MRTTPEPVDPLLTRPLPFSPARKAAGEAPSKPPAEPRRIGDFVLEIDGRWHTDLPLPDRRPPSR